MSLRLTSDNLRIAQFFLIDELHVLCMKPPRCVLFHPFQPRPSSFHGLEDGIVPVFPIQRSITIKNYSLRRKQVPMCAAFGLTDYKAQGQTFSEGVVDLRRDSKGKDGDSHRNFCSVYVQLSRFTTLQGLHLLEDIRPSDVSFKPHKDLVTEMTRLQALEIQTVARWSASEEGIEAIFFLLCPSSLKLKRLENKSSKCRVGSGIRL